MQINIQTQSDLLDGQLSIELSELLPQQRIKIVATMQDNAGQIWQSNNIFCADNNGYINTANQAPIKGSYQVVDPWGLIWSMTPSRSHPYSIFALHTLKPLELKLDFYIENKLVASRSIMRHILTSSVERIEIENDQVTGVVFKNINNQHGTGVVLVPGANGVAANEPLAALLASKGLTVLLLAYSRYKTLPSDIYDLPLERLYKGIGWFRQQPYINKNQIIGIGLAKGAEGLLATASYFPHLGLKLIIANAPSHVIWQGIGKGKPLKRSSWSLFNEPLHFLPYREDHLFFEILKNKVLKRMRIARYFPKLAGVKLAASYKQALKSKRQAIEAEIPVEKIQCPIIFVSGEDDQVWPSKIMCQKLLERLEKKQFQYPIEHWNYEGAGHLFYSPGLPTTVNQVHLPVLDLSMGGQKRLAAEANTEYWHKLITAISANS